MFKKQLQFYDFQLCIVTLIENCFQLEGWLDVLWWTEEMALFQQTSFLMEI